MKDTRTIEHSWPMLAIATEFAAQREKEKLCKARLHTGHVIREGAVFYRPLEGLST